ncbi:hypothetical protein [Chromobacterium sp. IIBBL 290-4]|uniref:hypothetical protein n=1 Tax=Chromobacterium sp. IIBBL 290-4 TaxID=2953890 RepID=UPI0020B79ED8|nr:hypothetical protein [Chromobacterium sp. IIBBL 290-4]UTH73973.1 hypothetical protein NKT35_20890 [Chromobacterium sp. IIBBL 290-4]
MPIYRIAGMAVKHDGQLLEEGQTIELDEPQLSPWLVEVKTTQASEQQADSKTDQQTDTESEDSPPAGDTAKTGKKGEGK